MAKKSRQPAADRPSPLSTQGRDHTVRVDPKAPQGDGLLLSAAPRRWPLLVALASAFGVALGAVVVALNLISATSTLPPVRPAGVASSVQPPQTGSAAPAGSVPAAQGVDRRSLGNPNAPVVVTEWSDFQCPACRIYGLNREPALEQQYVNTGKVRFVYRNFAFLGPESLWAAEAAEAAADQGKYLEYRSLLWQRQRGENLGAFKVANLKAFAAELGLNQAAFDAALDNQLHRAAVLAEKKEGEAQGINATPTIFVNDRKMQGVPTLEAMKAVIEEELAKKR